MLQVKGNNQRGGAGGTGNAPPGVQALGENLSQLDLSEASRKEIYRQQAGVAGGGVGVGGAGGGGGGAGGGGGGGGAGGDADSSRQVGAQGIKQQSPQRHHRPQPNYTQPLRDDPTGWAAAGAGAGGGLGAATGAGAGHKRHGASGLGGSNGSNVSKGSSGDWAHGGHGRKPTAAEAAELLRRR